MSRQTISVAIIAYNEKDNIRRCLESLSWADEIVVVDNGSDDGTLDICAEFKCRVIHHEWEGYARQKNFSLSQASCDWILSLDADEVITDAGSSEIQSTIESASFDVYSIPRLNSFLGRWMHHGGWYPDRQIRLFRKGCGEFKLVPIHESFQPYKQDTKIGRLNQPMQHYTYNSVSSFMKKSETYSSLDADRMISQGKLPKSMISALIFSMPIKFAEVYIYKSGWKDGIHGFISATLISSRVFTRTVKIWEKCKNKS